MARTEPAFDENFRILGAAGEPPARAAMRLSLIMILQQFRDYRQFKDCGMRAANIKLQRPARGSSLSRRAPVVLSVGLPARLGFSGSLPEMNLVIDPLDPGQRDEVMLAAGRLI
jgi:hypothetical protein